MFEDLPVHLLMMLCGLAGGLVMGLTGRIVRFCTFGAFEDSFLAGKHARLKSWGITIATAIALVQAMYLTGIARMDESFYLAPQFNWLGLTGGGLIFGYGMSLVGTCAWGSIVRAAGGDLRSLFNCMIIGLFAYMTARGLTGIPRTELVEPTALDLPIAAGQHLPALLAYFTNISLQPLTLLVSGLTILVILVWALRGNDLRSDPKLIISGMIIGGVIAFGFWATGQIGDDAFDPQRVQSFSFALPPGETIVYLLTFSGAEGNFSIGAVFGTMIGAFIVAAWRGRLRLEAFDDGREMRRHMLGSALMGVGGVFAMGCTVGQGMSGIATLSIGAPVALVAIFAGAWLGINVLIEGSFRNGLNAALNRSSH